MEKFLIVGLGNIGPDYEGTRHNIGFRIVDALAASAAKPLSEPLSDSPRGGEKAGGGEKARGEKDAGGGKVVWEDKRYGFVTRISVKGRQLILLKPSTFMNLSGNAVRYWMQQEKIELSHLLICVDDIALPFGQMRMKPGGSDAGHNGLTSFPVSRWITSSASSPLSRKNLSPSAPKLPPPPSKPSVSPVSRWP